MPGRHLLSFLSCRRGAAAAELVLIMPLLVIIMFGGFEAGAYLWAEQKVVKGVRDGARFAARQSFTAYSCSTITDWTILGQVKNLTRTGQLSGGTAKIAGWGSDPNDVQVTAYCAGNADSCSPKSGADYVDKGVFAGLGGTKTVKVSATVDYPSLFGTLGFDTTGAKVTASACAAVMGI